MRKNTCHYFSDLANFGEYSTGSAQIDEKLREIKISILPTIFCQPNGQQLRHALFFISGIKNQHGGILQSLGTTEEIIILLSP